MSVLYIPGSTYLNKNYNVEYFTSNHKVHTFNGNLVNIDTKFFYFEREDGGLIMIMQDCIRTMVCAPSEIIQIN